MKIINLKNYFSLNLLSVLGYIIFSYWIYKLFIQIPAIHNESFIKKSVESDMLAYNNEFKLFIVMAVFLIIALLLIVISSFENYLQKKKKIPNVSLSGSVYNMLFWLGIFLYTVPYNPITYLLTDFIYKLK